MGFYSSISHFYDEIFPFDAQEAAFVAEQLSCCMDGGGRILDIGCGTGNKTVHMAAPQRLITAIDGNADMIAQAKARNPHPYVEYRNLDMNAVAGTFGPDCFESVLCLGNTLVHLPKPGAIARMIHDMGSVLKTNGLLVLQILNYDRLPIPIPLDQPFALPLLETEHLRFERYYEFHDDVMFFVTTLTEKQSGQILCNSIPLYPLRRLELDTMLADAGFGSISYYGSYRGDPLTPDSFPLIVTARKQPA